MKPWRHARNSVKKYGGIVKDYIKIHDWFDSSKAHVPDMRHRAMFHHSFGIYLCEQVFGTCFVNSDGKTVQVRDVAEDHVLEDMGGFIPTLQDWLTNMSFTDWTGGRKPKERLISFEDND